MFLKSSPSDVLLVDSDSVSLLRFARSKSELRLLHAKRARFSDVFTPAPVSPVAGDIAPLSEAIRRLKSEAGGVDHVAVLLPDSWFRMNILELAELPERRSEADEVVRWSLKRTMPVAAEQLRIAYQVVGRNDEKRRLLAISAVDNTLGAIEASVREAGMSAVVIEPVGLNLWNAITVREASTTRDRLLVHVREREFTTAVFRGGEPLFLRSRNLGPERSVAQEIRLSASYLRDNLRLDRLEHCYLAADSQDGNIDGILGEEFSAPVTRVMMRDYVTAAPGLEAVRSETEVIASSGVFAA